MANILLIETSSPVCSVGLSADGSVVAMREASGNQSHSELVTIFIEEVLAEYGIAFSQLHAVAVSMGPGSYTGLRIGVSTAKGICYALDIPLIAIDTLSAMAEGMLHYIRPQAGEKHFFCPMIDARRMEVYTAVFDETKTVLEPVHALILEHESLGVWFGAGQVWLAGDGAHKSKEIWPNHPKLHILEQTLPSAKWMAKMAHEQYKMQQFANLAYFEPFYLKDFVAGIPRVKGL